MLNKINAFQSRLLKESTISYEAWIIKTSVHIFYLLHIINIVLRIFLLYDLLHSSNSNYCSVYDSCFWLSVVDVDSQILLFNMWLFSLWLFCSRSGASEIYEKINWSIPNMQEIILLSSVTFLEFCLRLEYVDMLTFIKSCW